MPDDQHRLPAAFDGCPNAFRGGSGGECVARLGGAAKGVRKCLACLACPQERAGQDCVRPDARRSKSLPESLRLLAALAAESAKLVRLACLGVSMPNQEEAQAQARSRAGNSRRGGPTYSADGRMILLSAYCSSTWADQPATRLAPKTGVNRSVGTPR